MRWNSARRIGGISEAANSSRGMMKRSTMPHCVHEPLVVKGQKQQSLKSSSMCHARARTKRHQGLYQSVKIRTGNGLPNNNLTKVMDSWYSYPTALIPMGTISVWNRRESSIHLKVGKRNHYYYLGKNAVN